MECSAECSVVKVRCGFSARGTVQCPFPGLGKGLLGVLVLRNHSAPWRHRGLAPESADASGLSARAVSPRAAAVTSSLAAAGVGSALDSALLRVPRDNGGTAAGDGEGAAVDSGGGAAAPGSGASARPLTILLVLRTTPGQREGDHSGASGTAGRWPPPSVSPAMAPKG